ncbi:putative RNA pseudouridylate synthase [Trypanosoma conorhini]|uniref:Putative RNA pseudouridylate synthase n=1 Tax=Trypanosoma conorhini TaxID=83891 RepID=A0A3R7P787_9TRYP|nr:putative RNA pseudouridylate synthase [Trypanosoma conorhini]RNF18613.1 putative RNA pseudouridylate synthase [Trypanosoma conorhini]
MALGGRVAVPRSYVRAVGRGLRSVLRRQPGTPALHGQRCMLDEALHHAAAFQERAARRWAAAALGPAQPYWRRRPRPGEAEAAGAAAPLTLQHLAGVEAVPPDGHEAEEEDTLTFAERQQARLHAALQQWVFYASFRCNRAEFVARQSKVAKILLLAPLRVTPSSHSSPAGAERLEASVRRRGARAYVDLLVHHKLAMQREGEWAALCETCARARGEPQESSVDASQASRVMALPLLQSSSPDASWERSLAVLSWAMQFRSHRRPSEPQQPRHISSVDIAAVLQQYAQHFGERLPGLTPTDDVQAPLVLGGAAEHAVVTRLQRWWVAAREAEQRDPKLAELCGLDRTVQDRIQVEGRKVTLATASEADAGADAAFAELLLQGRWEDVLRHVERVAAAALRRREAAAERQKEQAGEEDGDADADAAVRGDVAGAPGEAQEGRRCTSGDTAVSDVLATFFNRPRPLVVKGKLWVHSTAARLGRAPHALLTAAETPAEAELLRRPPTAGLHARRGLPKARGKVQGKGGTDNPPAAALVELRRKMWIHSQLPRHVPHSIVRFEGAGAAMLPYVWRAPAKELAAWLLLSTIAAAAEGQQLGGVEDVLHRVRMQTLYTLFSPVPYYAAFQEYTSGLLIQLGNLLAPPAVMRVAVRALLRPPSLRHFYDVRKRRRIPVEVACRRLWWGSLEEAVDAEDGAVTGSALSQSAARTLGQLRRDPDALKEFVVCKAASLRNYHVSTWIESCSKVETLAGLLDLLVRETNMYGPPVLAPEAAAALLTAVLLLLLRPHLPCDSAAGEEEQTVAAATDALRTLGVVYFAVPAERAHGAAPYFKGVYHERYIAATPLDWAAAAGWSGAEALLVGRSIRRTTKYPTTTTETFFRVARPQRGPYRGAHCPTVSCRVPELRLRLMTVDLLAAAGYFAEQRQKQSAEVAAAPDAQPGIVARHLPFGVVAVQKPAGMSTTLHAAYPHLVNFLARCVPWRGGDVPVLFQHGLVNRIDVGTSGLVLVTETEPSLVATRRASVVDRRVEKTYRALVLHCPPPASRLGREEFWYLNPSGVITGDVFANGADYALQLAAQDGQRGRGLPPASMDRRPATTVYRVLRYYPASGVYDVEVRLRSGRRHQIRQHFAQLCHPLLGDARYHARAKALGEQMGLHRLALHASRITLLPPPAAAARQALVDAAHAWDANSEKTVVECPLPDDMRRALRWLQEREEKRGGGGGSM